MTDLGRRSRRIVITLWLMLAALTALLARLAWIQCAEHEKWAELARRSHFGERTLPPERGLILDRHGKELAVTCRVPSVFANPRAVGDPDATARRLARLLHLDPARVRARLDRPKYFVWIKRHVTAAEAEAVRRAGLEGVGFRREKRRFYTTGPLAAHVAGFTDIDNRGLAGAEKAFDAILAGRPGREIVRYDGRRRAISIEGTRLPPVPGMSVMLAMDARIQAICREEVRAAVEKWKARWGIAVAMDPRNGDVLAMVSYPDFDPNAPADADRAHRRNHAIGDWFEPGSTLKPFTAAALLETGAATPETRIFCHNGVRYFGRHRVRDVHGYGWLTLKMVVVKSSNIGIIEAARRLGPERLYGWLRRFGFGAPTGIRLPGEAEGLLRPVSRWTSYSMSSVPMGQEIACTGLQLVRAFCVFANGGYLVRPRVVLGIASNDGKRMVRRFPVERRRVLSESVARMMCRDILADVVNVGTARRARLAECQLAGKTGTAQIAAADGSGYEPGAYIGLFVGIAPADDPNLVVLVALNRPRGAHYGGTVAAPAVAEIIRRSLVLRMLPPQGIVTARR